MDPIPPKRTVGAIRVALLSVIAAMTLGGRVTAQINGSAADQKVVEAPAPTLEAGRRAAERSTDSDSDRDLKTGFLLDVPLPWRDADLDRLQSSWARLAMTAAREPAGTVRTTVVLRFVDANGPGDLRQSVDFEDALKLARAISGREFQRLRFVAWVDTAVTGHAVLPVLAAETLVVSPDGSLGDVSAGNRLDDETIFLSYEAIAKRRGLFPPAIVAGLVRPDVEVARVSLVDGEGKFVAGDELTELRRGGRVSEETSWSGLDEPLTLSADRLRELRAAIAVVGSAPEVADRLELAELRSEGVDAVADAVGSLLRISGSVARERVRRWQSNLAATTESGETNTWLVAIDSPGGSLEQSVALAAVFADPGPSIRTVGGFVSGQARGDASLLALACRPLLMAPEATLGGSGAESIGGEAVQQQRELITLIAASTGRSESLLRGLLDPKLSVHRYVNRRTGRIRYATADEINEGGNQDPAWRQEERIELSEPLSPARAIELGLADGEAASLTAAASVLGLPAVPPELADRGLVRFVERIGRSDGLAFLVLLVGFMMLSTEASAPGLGVPGFIALLCFALFFWIKFLAGTAEWLELLAFGLGIGCIAIEIFILPGFGVFGIGGLLLTVLGVVLMSQTFVIPRNAYQIGEATRGLYVALGGLGGMIGGLFIVRSFFPQAALASGLAMGTPEPRIDEFERIARYDHLLGETGVATTPLRPSGKAQFGDTVVAVVSDATAIDAGQSIRVQQVQGNRIVVEAWEG